MNLPNIRIKKILYATDLSETAVHAFAYAVSLADTYGAGITMLHVITETASEEFISSMINAKTLKEVKNRHYSEARKNLIGKKRDNVSIREVLQTFSDEVKADAENHSFVTDEILILEGPPVETIINTAIKQNCDLIVMGTHGQGGITKVLVGSTAKKVVRQSAIPVLVVRLP